MEIQLGYRQVPDMCIETYQSMRTIRNLVDI